VDVINMSFSLDAPSVELQGALDYAYSKGVICIASAGNSGKPAMVYPAGFKLVEGVGSTDDKDRRSGFSNYGDTLVDLAAPGANLLTTYPGGNWALVSGTSFSTALVSGGAALVTQLYRDGGAPAQVEKDLEDAHPLPNQGLGAGRLDLFQACQSALNTKKN